jgi:hypothetical protein
MPSEKEEVFRSLRGWAAGSLLPILKPVDDCWQPTDFLPHSSSEMFEHEVRELRARTAALPDEYFVVLVEAASRCSSIFCWTIVRWRGRNISLFSFRSDLGLLFCCRFHSNL